MSNEIRRVGRPSTYTDAIAATICERIALGESLRKICSGDDMPAMFTVIRWLANPERKGFSEQYAHAREIQADTMAADTVDISDDSSRDTVVAEDGTVTVNHDVIARSRLRVDARKWLASKMAPKKYGDKQIIEGGDTPVGLKIEVVRFGDTQDKG